jgi:serine/threonine-protein kinase
MVMEFLSGHDLANELKLRGPLPTQEAVQYVLQASEAVAEAHALGVIHRDLKPANLFLTRRPDGTPLVKVLDFGIAKAIAPEQGAFEPSPSLTATHSFLGSPAYMSPEQVRTPKSVDTRSDIWSLGTILYELLMGELPFRGSNALDLLAAVASDPMPSMRQKRQDVSPELEQIIAKCLEKKPDDRYQSVASFAQALAPHAPPSSLPTVSRISGIQRITPFTTPSAGSLADGGTLRSTPAERPAGDSVTTHPSITPPAAEKHTITDFGRSQTMKPRSRSRVVVAAGVLGLCVIAALVVLTLRGRSAIEASGATSAAAAQRAPESSNHAVTEEPAAEKTQAAVSAVPPAVSPVGQIHSASPQTEPSAAPAPKPTRKTPTVTAPHRSPPPTAVAPAPAPATTATDPLEGRR